MGGWVYVIEEMGQHLFKVGHTTGDPQGRLRQLQTGNGVKLDLITAFTCQEPEIVEKALHRLLEARTQRMQGEWFALPREQMLDVLMHLYGGIAQQQGGIRFLASTLATRPSEAARLGESSVTARQRSQVDVEAIRQRVSRTTEGRDSERYSTFPVSGTARVGDVGGSYFGEVAVPFEAIAIGGPTHSTYNDHVLALIPKAHEDAEANAEFFAHARADVLALLAEIEPPLSTREVVWPNPPMKLTGRAIEVRPAPAQGQSQPLFASEVIVGQAGVAHDAALRAGLRVLVAVDGHRPSAAPWRRGDRCGGCR